MIKNLKNINAGDLNVSYFEAGSRKGLPVILLHGFPYDIHAYKEVVPLLMSSCRIIIPYLRGYGHTFFLQNDTIRSGQQAALGFDLLKLMDALKNNEFTTVRKWIVNNLDNDPSRMFRLVYDSLYDYLDGSTIPHAVVIIGDYSYKSAFVADQEINMLACMTELMGAVKFK